MSAKEGRCISSSRPTLHFQHGTYFLKGVSFALQILEQIKGVLNDAGIARGAEEVPHIVLVAKRHDARQLYFFWQQVTRPYNATLFPCMNGMTF